ncbi:pyruvate dehydrogenase complex dihydrolipoamide acetyltransferase component (E2) [Tulasnella sp. 330]|nr:pyruvate dehydrogenase complex dihydrolipoamide acetyltransferase component (E2) [Tulasnella sp. 330]
MSIFHYGVFIPSKNSVVEGLHSSTRRHALSKFTMPAMSPTMQEGGIASWKKQPGETFTAGDVILEIETDKATMDVEAQDDGVLAKIMVGDGSKGVKVGTTIAIMAEEGDDISGADALASESSSSDAKSVPSEYNKDAEDSKAESKQSPTSPALSAGTEAPKSMAPQGTKDTSAAGQELGKGKKDLSKGDRIFATPIAKKIALEQGIPLAKIKGTGPEGRITREDVEKYKPGSTTAAAAQSSASKASKASNEPVASEYTDMPVSNMRKVIASRLLQSKLELPHYYVTVDVDMGKTNKLREVFNKSLAEKEGGAKLSVNDFIVKASAMALKDVPDVNSAWMGETIRQYTKADICMAVSTPTGLITPIIRDVGGKGLATISSEAKALAKKARDGKLQPAEYQGGSFTISNLGMFGVSHFTAIINQPHAAILAVGATQATLAPAPHEEKGFEVKHIMKATLSSDHRVVDGAVAARWLAAFKGYLENPLSMML